MRIIRHHRRHGYRTCRHGGLGSGSGTAAAGRSDATADTNGDGKVTLEEYQAFTEQGWDFVSQGADKVKVADLDDQAKLAFFGIQPDAQGYVTHKMYTDAAPARFKLFDTDKNGSVNADEINGRDGQQN